MLLCSNFLKNLCCCKDYMLYTRLLAHIIVVVVVVFLLLSRFLLLLLLLFFFLLIIVNKEDSSTRVNETYTGPFRVCSISTESWQTLHGGHAVERYSGLVSSLK